jgi:hypothetical protein
MSAAQQPEERRTLYRRWVMRDPSTSAAGAMTDDEWAMGGSKRPLILVDRK